MSLKNFTVLYVEDSKLSREYINTLLKNKVKAIYFANDGNEGLKKYSELKPDIIISDIIMPNMDGLQMSKIIKKHNPKLPIILLSNAEDILNLKKAIDIGINSFLSKPFNNQEILERLTLTAIDLNNQFDEKKVKELSIYKEKIELVHRMFKEISHHWKQPLTTILSISSSYDIKKQANMYNSIEEEMEDIRKISYEIENLSSILHKVETIDIDNSDLKDIENLIKISNPLYC